MGKPELTSVHGALAATHIVARRVSLNRVLSSQGDATHRDDQQDAHLKVPQVHHIVAETSDPAKHTITRHQHACINTILNAKCPCGCSCKSAGCLEGGSYGLVCPKINMEL